METYNVRCFLILYMIYFTIRTLKEVDAQKGGPGGKGGPVGKGGPGGPQQQGPEGHGTGPPQMPPGGMGATDNISDFFKTAPTTPKVKRTTISIVSTLDNPCDYQAYYCLRVYDTGRICARTVHYHYENFTNYCMMDYVNCRENYNIWIIAHMGDCMFLKQDFLDYTAYEYHDDIFMDQTYVMI